MDIRFDQKIVAVTGAGHGFGHAIASRFAALGARVFGTDVSFSGTPDPRIETHAMDLRDRAAATAWIASIEKKTGAAIDILVNNAGGVAGQTNRPVEDVPDEDWNILFDIGVNAAFVLCRAVTPGRKRAGGGRIINISSGAGLQASLTGIQAYCAGKHAVVGLTRQLAHELGPFNITVNSVAPGFIRSNPASEAQWDSYGPDGQRGLLDRIAMKRLGSPEDIANGVVFFASELAAFVNGQVLQVDGGR